MTKRIKVYEYRALSGLLIAHIEFVNSSYQWSGLGTSNTWIVDHVHLHWGSTDALGSDHTLDGLRYPFEVHLRKRLCCSTSIRGPVFITKLLRT